MKIRNKLRVGFGLLFMTVIFFGILSLFFVKRLSESSQVILDDNFKSLKYIREMRGVLDLWDSKASTSSYRTFDQILADEEQNITEPGEKPVVMGLRKVFNRWSDTTLSPPERFKAEQNVKLYLGRLADINLNAVVEKSRKSQTAVDEAVGFLALLTALTFLILFSLVFNLVGFLEVPFKELMEGFKDISHRKRLYKINYDKNDEWSDVFSAYNEMIINLDRYHKNVEEKQITEKLKAEAIIKCAADPIIVLNQHKEIVEINVPAEKLFKLDRLKIIGKNILSIPDPDNFIKEIASIKKRGDTIRVLDDTFVLDKTTIVIPSQNISTMQDAEITVVGKMVQEVIILKRSK